VDNWIIGTSSAKQAVKTDLEALHCLFPTGDTKSRVRQDTGFLLATPSVAHQESRPVDSGDCMGIRGQNVGLTAYVH
jgi:hypothetical protein